MRSRLAVCGCAVICICLYLVGYLFVFGRFCVWFGFTLVDVDCVVVFDVGVGVTGYALCWLWTCR